MRSRFAPVATPASRFATLACALVLLAACGERPAANAGHGADAASEPLPGPEQAGGAVTGMSPRPGPGEVPLSGAPPAPPPEPADQVDLLNPETGLLPGGAPSPDAVAIGATPGDVQAPGGTPGDPALAAEPGPGQAAAVIRDYYAAINGGSYARAYALWSDGGRASKQTPQQFAAGFADTARVEVAMGDPGRVDAGAGQRYIQVPVAVTATRKDGSVHRYDGTYTLRRAVVDGASAEQRAWRIASADLRELQGE